MYNMEWSLNFLGIHVRYTTDSVISKISSLWLLSDFQTCTYLLQSMQSPLVQFLCLLCQVKKEMALRLLKSLNKKAFTQSRSLSSFFFFFSVLSCFTSDFFKLFSTQTSKLHKLVLR